MQKPIHSRKVIKGLWKKFQKILLGVHPSFLQEKQLLMRVSFKNHETYANLLLGLTLANCTPTRCVNQCRPVFIRVDISIQRRVALRLDKTRPQLGNYGLILGLQRPGCKIQSLITTDRHDKKSLL